MPKQKSEKGHNIRINSPQLWHELQIAAAGMTWERAMWQYVELAKMLKSEHIVIKQEEAQS